MGRGTCHPRGRCAKIRVTLSYRSKLMTRFPKCSSFSGAVPRLNLGLRKLTCARTVPKPYSFVRLGLALSEKQTPQVIEKIETPTEQMEGLESRVALRRQTISRAPFGKISNKWLIGLNKRWPFEKTESFTIPILRWHTLIFSQPI